MPPRLLTTWYGSFLLSEGGEVLGSATFPKDAEEIAGRLMQVRKGEVLDEERSLAPREGGFHVLEYRLLALGGAELVEASAGGAVPPDPASLGFPGDLLREASLQLATHAFREALPPDQPVILYLRSMDLVERESARALEMLRYWHTFHFPELGALVDDGEFLRLVRDAPDRKGILRARPDLDPGRDSGRSLAPGEGEALAAMAGHILSTKAEAARLRERLESAILETAPNLAAVAGPLVGARLLSLAGSLERLSRMPSSTIQLLGAERALFLHIKEGAPPPKHGVVFQHPAVHSSPPWLRGRVARALAGKVAIAVRADYAGTHADGDLGQELRDQFLERVRQLRTQHPEPPPGWRRARPRDPRRRGGRGKGRRGSGRRGPRGRQRDHRRRRR